MALQLLEATAKDVSDLTRVFSAALQKDNAVDRIMFHKGLTPAAAKASDAGFEADMASTESRYLKVVLKPSVTDSDGVGSNIQEERIIAFARWYLFLGEKRDTKWGQAPMEDEGKYPMGPPEDVNYEVANLIMENSRRTRDQNVKDPRYVYLSMLATHPEYTGLGAGSKLVEWGTKVADEHKLNCWLQSTPSAHSFYYKYGFQDVSFYSIDLSKYADREETLKEPYAQTLMRRRPEPLSG